MLILLLFLSLVAGAIAAYFGGALLVGFIAGWSMGALIGWVATRELLYWTGERRKFVVPVPDSWRDSNWERKD